MLFVASIEDQKAQMALSVLKEAGFNTKTVGENQDARASEIAVFSIDPASNAHKRRRFLRTSSVRLKDELCPKWARSTRLRVGVIRTENTKKFARRSTPFGFKTSVLEMAKRYTLWLEQGSSLWTPWSAHHNDPAFDPGKLALKALREWLESEEIKIFRTQNLIVKSGGDIRVMRVGQWDVNCCAAPRVFSAEASKQALALLGKWQKVFAKENTWAQSYVGIPSLIVRLDCIVRDGQLVVYEVEERPAGVGISSIVNPEFGKRFVELASTWQPFSVVVSPFRRATDDSLWQEQLPWGNHESGLVLVRAEPEEQQFHLHEPNSVSSLKRKGDKGYGEALGLWQKVKFSDELNWSESFVLKPLQGSKLKDLEIWDPQRRPGSSRREVVEQTLAASPRGMFCQKLFPPMESGIARFPWMIFRVFFGYDHKCNEWKALGGNWNARHNLRIHGATDAIFGPAVIE